MLHAGRRAAEVLALTVYDVEWLSGQLTVRQGKGKKDRILWLNETLLEELRRWRARRPPSPTGLLFPTRKGTPVYSAALRAMVKRWGQKAGLGHIDVHLWKSMPYRLCIMLKSKALSRSVQNRTSLPATL